MVPDGWKEATLASVCRDKISYGVVQTGEHVPDGVPCLRVADLPNGRVAAMVKTSVAISNSYKRTLLKRSDIVLALRGDIGLACLVKNEWAGINITRGIARISPDSSQILPEFLLWELRSPRLKGEFSRRAGGSALQEISIGELRCVTVLIPPLPEQVKIAKILSIWDQAITTTEQLLENSHLQKKALRHRLLVGKERFPQFRAGGEYQKTKYGEIPADWQFVSLASIATQVSQKNAEGRDFPVLSCSKHYGFVNSLDYFNKKVYSADVSGYKIIKRGCFGFPSNHIEEGSIGYQNICEIGIVSPIYIVFRANEQLVNNEFLYAVLKSEHYKQIFAAATNASVDRRGSLRWDDFSKIKVQLPSLEEQRAIVSALITADSEIAILQKKLACLKQEKKALMQQLLTGKRRVKVDELEVA